MLCAGRAESALQGLRFWPGKADECGRHFRAENHGEEASHEVDGDGGQEPLIVCLAGRALYFYI